MECEAFSPLLAGAQNNASRLICMHEEVLIRLLGETVDTVLGQGQVSTHVASKIGYRLAIRISGSWTAITKHNT